VPKLIFNIKVYRFICLLALIVTTDLQTFSQNIKGAVIIGTNLSQVDGDEVYGYKKFGLNTGASAIMTLNDNLSIQLETLLSQKGAFKKYSNQWSDTTPYYNLRLNYLEVPVLLTYNDRDIITAGTGISWARLSNITEIEHGKVVPQTNKRGEYYRNDIQWIADIRFRTYKRMYLNLRYAYSLAPIRLRTFTTIAGNSWERRQYNNLLSFRLVWIFNEKLPPDIDNGKKKK
jgi:hypothetical protein